MDVDVAVAVNVSTFAGQSQRAGSSADEMEWMRFGRLDKAPGSRIEARLMASRVTTGAGDMRADCRRHWTGLDWTVPDCTGLYCTDIVLWYVGFHSVTVVSVGRALVVVAWDHSWRGQER